MDTTLGFEADDGRFCENCLADKRISFDERSGRHLCIECEPHPVKTDARALARMERRMPEWRRRSLEGRGRFDAVNDMTDRVAGR